MGFAGFAAIVIGILLVVLSANGRLQNVIAAMFGQSTPGAMPVGGAGGSGGSNPITQGGPLWQWLMNGLQGITGSGSGGTGGDGGYYGGSGGGDQSGGSGGSYGR